MQLLVFINAVLLEHSHMYLFKYFLWLPLCYHGRAEQRPYSPQSLKYLLFDALQKTFADISSSSVMMYKHTYVYIYIKIVNFTYLYMYIK